MSTRNPFEEEEMSGIPTAEIELQALKDEIREQANRLLELNQILAKREEEIRLLTRNTMPDPTRDLEQSNPSFKTDIHGWAHLEERLRLSERHLGVAQQLSRTGSYSWYAASGKIVWSDETYRIYGYPQDVEPTMELTMKRIHPDDLHILEERFRNGPGELHDYWFQHRLLMPDGEIKHLKVITRFVREQSGQGVFLGAVMDITAQKKVEEALRASERVALGQADTFKEILNSISTEIDPDRYLYHVLSMVAQQMGGQSVTVFHRNSDDTLTLQVIFDNDQLVFPKENTRFPTKDQPMWAEAMHTGTDCPITEFDRDPIWFRFANRPDYKGSPRLTDTTSPFVAEVHHRIKAQGTIMSLAIPLVTSGRVTGYMGIRYRQRRDFPPEEIDLGRALAHQAAFVMQLMRLYHESQRAAISAERNRMARDIHDTLAQGFTGVITQLQAAKAVTRLADASTHIEKAEKLARLSLGEARRSVKALRPRSLEEGNLKLALEDLLSTMARDSDLSARFVIEGEQRALPPDWEEGLLRIAQEALTNTIKHARAKNFQATLSFASGKIQLKIDDDGLGFDPRAPSEGFGLIGIKERVDQLGGALAIHSRPGHGTHIVTTLNFP